MNALEALQRVERIRASRGDDEAAHSMEDGLYREFITEVALSDHPLAGVAKIVLTTQDIEFSRWCA
jgi:hypothetical protein